MSAFAIEIVEDSITVAAMESDAISVGTQQDSIVQVFGVPGASGEAGPPGTTTIAGIAGLQTQLDAKQTASQVGVLIANAVAGLVNSSPSTLDTLNELATALGNDPNFATTVTNALGLRATKVYVDTPAKVFVQQQDPDTTNPEITGPAVWYQTNGSGTIIGKKVRTS